jgi:hypothetical protein
LFKVIWRGISAYIVSHHSHLKTHELTHRDVTCSMPQNCFLQVTQFYCVECRTSVGCYKTLELVAVAKLSDWHGKWTESHDTRQSRWE